MLKNIMFLLLFFILTSAALGQVQLNKLRVEEFIERYKDTVPDIDVSDFLLIRQYRIDKSKTEYLSVSNTHIENFDVYDSKIKISSFRLGKYEGVGLNNLLGEKVDFFHVNSKIIKIDSSDLKTLVFLSDTVSNSLSINRLIGNELSITESTINALKVKNIDVKNIILNNTYFKKNSQISGHISGTISLKDVEFESSTILDLRFLRHKLPGRRINLDLISCPIDKILIDYRNFKLVFEIVDIDQINGVYEALLDNFKKNGQSESYRLLDIEYKSYKNRKLPLIGIIWDKCNLLWWNYGYSRERVIWCTLLILVVFSLINIPMYRKMNKEIYNIDNFAPQALSVQSSFLTSLKYSFIYTTIIFFKFDVSIEKLKMTNTLLLIWFAIIYFTGLFCTFFILNALLKI
jgi:hypothetical protein